MFDIILPLSTIALTIIGTVWSLAWWLSHKFSEVRNLVYDKIDSLEKGITEKLEYHERHDDLRFNTIRNDVWDLRLRNAARDGLIAPPRTPSEGENYSVEPGIFRPPQGSGK